MDGTISVHVEKLILSRNVYMVMLFYQYGCCQGNGVFDAVNEKIAYISFYQNTVFLPNVEQESSTSPMQQILHGKTMTILILLSAKNSWLVPVSLMPVLDTQFRQLHRCIFLHSRRLYKIFDDFHSGMWTYL